MVDNPIGPVRLLDGQKLCSLAINSTQVGHITIIVTDGIRKGKLVCYQPWLVHWQQSNRTLVQSETDSTQARQLIGPI